MTKRNFIEKKIYEDRINEVLLETDLRGSNTCGPFDPWLRANHEPKSYRSYNFHSIFSGAYI